MATGEGDVPERTCGFELRPEDVGVSDDIDDWREGFESVSCCRETWNEQDRCLWHADIEEKPAAELIAAQADGPERLDGAILRNVDPGDRISFAGCWLNGVTFESVDLEGASFGEADLQMAEFPDADFREAEFPDADFREAEFPDADLRRAEFPDADLRNAAFTRSPDPPNQYPKLEDAVFEGADLRGTDLSDAAFYQAVFTDARINQATTFPNPTPYERDPSPEWFDDEDPPPRAAWVYRRLESLHERNALSWAVGPYHVKKQEVERRAAYEDARSELARGNYRDALAPGGRYLASTVARLLTNHGESYRRVLASSAFVIVLSALLYPFSGGVASGEGTGPGGDFQRYHVAPDQISRIDSPPDLLSLVADGGQTAFHSLYFSVITFTTIGYGDMYPTGWGSKLLVGLESLAGAVLIALFIFVLGRRVSR